MNIYLKESICWSNLLNLFYEKLIILLFYEVMGILKFRQEVDRDYIEWKGIHISLSISCSKLARYYTYT